MDNSSRRRIERACQAREGISWRSSEIRTSSRSSGEVNMMGPRMDKETRGSVEKIERPMDRKWGRFLSGAMAMIVLVALGSPIARESPVPQESAAHHRISPAKEASIRKFLELTNAKQHAIDFGLEVSENLTYVLKKNLSPGEHAEEIGERVASELTKRLN